MGANEQRLISQLSEQAQHISRPSRIADAIQEVQAWQCLDTLVSNHVATWLDAASASVEAEQLRQLPQITDPATAGAATSVLEEVVPALRERVVESRSAVQKQTWSRAWPSAWNMESSSRWAYARDAAIAAASNASWRATILVLNRSGFLALKDAACGAEFVDERSALAELALSTTTSLIGDLAWEPAWLAAWGLASAETSTPPSVLGPSALEAASLAVEATGQSLFEESIVFAGELLRELL